MAFYKKQRYRELEMRSGNLLWYIHKKTPNDSKSKCTHKITNGADGDGVYGCALFFVGFRTHIHLV